MKGNQKTLLIWILLGYVFLYLLNIFFAYSHIENTLGNNVETMISFCLAIVPLYYLLNEEKPCSKYVFLIAEIIKLLRLVLLLQFTWLSILFLGTQILFCIFLYNVLFHKNKKITSKIAYLIIFLISLEVLWNMISYIRNFSTGVIINIVILIFYYIYKIILILYFNRK